VPDAPVEATGNTWSRFRHRNSLSEADKVQLMDRVAERFRSKGRNFFAFSVSGQGRGDYTSFGKAGTGR